MKFFLKFTLDDGTRSGVPAHDATPATYLETALNTTSVTHVYLIAIIIDLFYDRVYSDSRTKRRTICVDAPLSKKKYARTVIRPTGTIRDRLVGDASYIRSTLSRAAQL